MDSRKRFLFLVLIFTVVPMLVFTSPQEAGVNQKKIERDRAKKQKQAKKDYERAVRQHNKRQSKSTRTSMKKTKRESEKATPLRH